MFYFNISFYLYRYTCDDLSDKLVVSDLQIKRIVYEQDRKMLKFIISSLYMPIEYPDVSLNAYLVEVF
jgi:uncharacterized membrane protein YdjX (TVP38/TMEM64 family)